MEERGLALAQEWVRYEICVDAPARGYRDPELNADVFSRDARRALRVRMPRRWLRRLQEREEPAIFLPPETGSFMTAGVVVVEGGRLASDL